MGMPKWDKVSPPRATIKPQGKLTIVDTELNQTETALYPDIIMIDEAGKLWKAHSATFMFDLLLVGEEEEN